jgi:SPP1 gp7 family putative phage head morphogenesis protein
MTNQQKQLVKQALDDFFYKSRINIGLEKAIESEDFQKFESKIFDAISKQVDFFAKVDKVNQVVGINKAVKQLTELELLDEIALIWIPITQFISEIEFNQYMRSMAQRGGEIALSKIKTDKSFFLKDESLIRSISVRAKESISQIDKTTLGWIARTIEQGLRDQASNVQIAKLLRDALEKYAEDRASLIAEHEAAIAIAWMEQEFYKRNGIEYHQWITSRDELVCPTCVGNEAIGIIQVGTLFPSGGTHPPAHFRCRCFIKPIIKEGQIITWTG